MKPNFALDLTFDGLALLHRAGEAGWHVVGEVSLDSPFLSGDLAALRKKANTLDPSGMRTKLIIPDEQIRYLDIPAASAPHGDHATAAADALDGATPYALDDLAYDWTVRDGRIHVAAVARETLDEAEGFAREHMFNPVCFVADPDQDLFAGEPFFGMTAEAGAAGPVTRDTGPMKRLGALPDAEAEAGERGTDDAAQESVALSFASVRAERGLPPRVARRLEGVARITPGPLADADARALSGAARASLAPRDDIPAPPAPQTGPSAPSPAPKPEPRSSKGRSKTTKAAKTAAKAPPVAKPTKPAAAGTAPAAQAAEAPAAQPAPSDEAERLTIFGARNKQQARRGKPRFLGLILTAALLVILIGVAAWAAIFPETGLGRLLRGAEPQIAVTPDIPELQDAEPQPPAGAADPATAATGSGMPGASGTPEEAPATADPAIAALPEPAAPDAVPEDTGSGLESGTAAAIEPEPDPETPARGWTEPQSPEEARRRYAATGIWPSAPDAPDEPGGGNLDTFYQTSVDVDVAFGDAVALPRAQALAPDPAPSRPSLPPPPGRTFELDARGFIRATPEGTLTPEGIRVHSGPPPVRPPETPARAVPVPGLTPTDEAIEARENLSGIRPRSRPETLIEEHERGALGGRTRTELAALRPRSRPSDVTAQAAARAAAQAEARAAAEAVARATEEAIVESLKPRLRPATVARSVATSRPPEPVAAPAAPSIPTSASVARSATERNAINLRQVNLIGVYGTPADRRALVRLANGQYRKVQVGDRIDGGRVSAIGDSELRYTKSGRNVVLRIPRG
jgi:hypothetical protein